jgi:hypothetical protein
MTDNEQAVKHSIGSQMSYHLKKITNFDVNRINSIHHGKVGFTVSRGRISFRSLIIQDNLEKAGIPPKPSLNCPGILQQLINTIDLNRKTYYGIKNGRVYFLIKDWRIYKQEIFLSDLEFENTDRNSLQLSDVEKFPDEGETVIETILEEGETQHE